MALGVDIASVALSGLSFIGGGIGRVSNYRKQREAAVAEAQYNQGLLKNEMAYLEASTANEKRSLSETLAQTLMGNAQGAWATGRQQIENAQAAAVASITTQQNLYGELADIQRQGMQAVGQQNAAASVSGFRNTGSIAGRTAQTAEEASRSYERALSNVQLSAYQSYMQAADSYFNANVQLEAYRQSSVDAKTNYATRLDALNAEFTYNENRINAEMGYWAGIEEANTGYDPWGEFLAFFGG